MSIEIKDLHQLPVQAVLVSAGGEVLDFVCGKTKAPMSVPYQAYIDIWLVAGTCRDGYGPSVPTMGDVVVRFE